MKFERAQLLCFGSFQLGDFVVDVLLDGVGVGSDDAAAVDEDRGRAVNLELVAIGDAGVDGSGRLRGCLGKT